VWEYYLAISDEGEILRLDRFTDTTDKNFFIYGDTLFLCSALIQAFFPLIRSKVSPEESMPQKEDVKQFLDAFCRKVTGMLSSYDEEVLQLGDLFWEGYFYTAYGDIKSEIILFEEVRSLAYAVNNWLGGTEKPVFHPGVLKPRYIPNLFSGLSSPFTDPQSALSDFAGFCLYRRSQQISTHPEIHPELFDGKLLRVHKSQHIILPFCWAEVWYCLEHKKRARVCPYCGKVFLPPPNNPKTAHCQSNPCRRAYLIEKHGGIEGYREWERTRKKKSSGKRGRPRKKDTKDKGVEFNVKGGSN